MRRFVALAVIVVAAAASAAVAPPTVPSLASLKEIRIGVQPATGVSLGAVNLTFESSTFGDASELGPAPVGHKGDASESVMWVCYTLPQEMQRLWLTSSELGGRTYIDGLVAEVIPGGTPTPDDCPELPKRFRHIHMDHGVWLGTPIGALKRQFGQPTNIHNGTLEFTYSGKSGEYDVESTLIVRLIGNRVVALHASHSTTN
jgi:hypothetical protein